MYERYSSMHTTAAEMGGGSTTQHYLNLHIHPKSNNKKSSFDVNYSQDLLALKRKCKGHNLLSTSGH